MTVKQYKNNIKSNIYSDLHGIEQTCIKHNTCPQLQLLQHQINTVSNKQSYVFFLSFDLN